MVFYEQLEYTIKHKAFINHVDKIRVLNLRPKIVPTCNRQRPYVGIIQMTEICVLMWLENNGYFIKVERLWQGVSKILLKGVKKRH